MVVRGVGLVLFWIAGCATGGEVDTGRGDAGPYSRRDGGGGEECVPACPDGSECRAGRCVVPGDDADGDGILAELDCDDGDPAIGSETSRECTSACGVGVEQCLDGAWLPCTAPSECTCRESDPPRTVPCGMCGMQRQVCTGGEWRDDGACMGAGECMPGDTRMGSGCGGRCGTEQFMCTAACTWGPAECLGEGACMAGEVGMETEACGACGEGTRTRTRTCGSDCTWGAFGAWGPCMTAAQCAPGETSSETDMCGNCNLGRRTRTRSCDPATCMWGAFGPYSACSGGGACSPGATRGCANGDSCGHEVCSSSCNWGSCQPRTAGGCLRIRPGTMGPEGNNYRCCGASRWQFCLASCSWSTDCATCSGCGC